MSEQEYISHEEGRKAVALADEFLPDQLFVLPVNGRPFFPAQVQPVIVDEALWGDTLEEVMESDHKLLGLSFVNDKDSKEVPTTSCIPAMGCVVRIHNLQIEDGRVMFIAQGIRRFKIADWIDEETPFLAMVKYPKHSNRITDEIKAYAMAIINAIKELVQINPLYSEELKHYLNRFSPNDPSPLTDFAAARSEEHTSELQSRP